MTDERWIDPAGVGRGAIIGTALPPEWVAAAEENDLDPSELGLAVELVELCETSAGPALVELVAALRLASSRGSTRLPLIDERLQQHLTTLGIVDVQAAVALARRLADDPEALRPLTGTTGDYAPLIIDEGHLFLQRHHELERRVAAFVRARLDLVEHDMLERAVADVCSAPPSSPTGRPLALAPQQRDAVLEACRGRLTLISGEPGTGKTFIVVSILRTLARLGVPLEAIMLTAPTGKAADRMRRSVEQSLASLRAPSFDDRALLTGGPESRTLHRLLGYSPTRARFRHHERNPLSEKVIIVDESSMIDVAMLDRLLRAMTPDARLILLGDSEQLPSVDAGAVFRDLCAALADRGRVVRLKDSFRMDPRDPAGRHVLQNARRIHAGDPAAFFGRGGVRVRKELDALELRGVEQIDVDRNAFLRWWDTRVNVPVEPEEQRVWKLGEGGWTPAQRAALQERLTTSERSRVLCMTRGRPTGTHAVNQQFHAWREESRRLRTSPRFLVGEPVLVMRNDYERRLFNGDQGLVLLVESDRRVRPCAVFRRAESFVAFPLETVSPILELAHAVTVHKAQGSEYDHVALVLPREPIPLLTREMLYTAVTRARTSVTLLGPKSSAEWAVIHRVERSSGLQTFVRFDEEQQRAGLCATCSHTREVVSAKGSVFFRCSAPEMPRYPALPVLQCPRHDVA